MWRGSRPVDRCAPATLHTLRRSVFKGERSGILFEKANGEKEGVEFVQQGLAPNLQQLQVLSRPDCTATTLREFSGGIIPPVRNLSTLKRNAQGRLKHPSPTSRPMALLPLPLAPLIYNV